MLLDRAPYTARCWDDDRVWINLPLFGEEPNGGVDALVHEFGHRVWFQCLSEKQQDQWGKSWVETKKRPTPRWTGECSGTISGYACTSDSGRLRGGVPGGGTGPCGRPQLEALGGGLRLRQGWLLRASDTPPDACRPIGKPGASPSPHARRHIRLHRLDEVPRACRGDLFCRRGTLRQEQGRSLRPLGATILVAGIQATDRTATTSARWTTGSRVVGRGSRPSRSGMAGTPART